MAATAVTPGRLAALAKARCDIFKSAYNPTSARTGAKYLRARLRGPSMVNYYPQDLDLSISKFAKEWPELELVNFAEAQRLWDVDLKKARGKGVPTKAKDKSMYVPTCRSRTSLKKLGNFFSRPEPSDTEKTICSRLHLGTRSYIPYVSLPRIWIAMRLLVNVCTSFQRVDPTASRTDCPFQRASLQSGRRPPPDLPA